MLQLPSSLRQLLAVGRWPRDAIEEQRQNLQPLVPRERVRRFAPEEDGLYLNAPPLRTVADHAATNKFWLHPWSAPTELDFDLALYLGDFGPGSDTAIVLDYRLDPTNPCVLRLRYSAGGDDNHWVGVASDFDVFASLLGLWPLDDVGTPGAAR